MDREPQRICSINNKPFRHFRTEEEARRKSMDYTAVIYVVITVLGIVYGAFTGYKEAKKADPTIDFDEALFFESLLRAIPGIIAAVASLAALGINIQGILTAFFAGAGSDVVIKRTWRSVKPTPSS
jgi:ABC-type dipeptide/oligopeptide/nickel transport system permease subunit